MHAALRRRRFMVRVHAGAPISNGGHDVVEAYGTVNSVVSGANPTGLPIFQNVRHAEVVEATGCNPVLIQCESGVSLQSFPRARGSQQTCAPWKCEIPGAAPGCPTTLIGSSTGPARRNRLENGLFASGGWGAAPRASAIFFQKLPLDCRTETVFKATHLPIFKMLA